MTIEAPNQLTTITQQCGLSETSAHLVVSAFAPIYAEAQELVKAAGGVKVESATDVAGIKNAKAMRLKLRAARIAGENMRKGLKDESLRYGQGIDRVAKVVEELIKPVEAEMLEQEEIAERMEEFRKSELKAARVAVLVPLGVNPSLYVLDEMPEDAFQSLLAGAKADHQRRQEEARVAGEKADAEKKAREEEEARIREENARLTKECQAADATAKAEREAREKMERELNAKKAEEAAQAAAAEKARKKAARAPDKEKLIALADQIAFIPMPSVTSREAEIGLREFKNRVSAAVAFLRQEAGAM